MPYKPFFTFNFSTDTDGKLGLPGGYTTGYGGSDPLPVLYGPDGIYDETGAVVPAFLFTAPSGTTCAVLGPGSDDVNGMHGCTFEVTVGFHEIPIRRIIDVSDPDHSMITIFTQ
tara:strand:- start:59 stop:400 length:342 start_codon:yes stop_codon:yes gene_type:complete